MLTSEGASPSVLTRRYKRRADKRRPVGPERVLICYSLFFGSVAKIILEWTGEWVGR
jgi:hypothetical protein